MIGRLRRRGEFDALRRCEPVRSGPLLVRAVSCRDGRGDAPDHPRVGYALPRSVGNAPTRNRIRRRLREQLRQIMNEDPELLPNGCYLVSVRPTDREPSYAELGGHLRRCLSELLRRRATEDSVSP